MTATEQTYRIGDMLADLVLAYRESADEAAVGCNFDDAAILSRAADGIANALTQLPVAVWYAPGKNAQLDKIAEKINGGA